MSDEYKIFNLSNECCICMEPLTQQVNIVLECNHIFHYSCIEYCHRCPICRIDITFIDLAATVMHTADYLMDESWKILFLALLKLRIQYITECRITALGEQDNVAEQDGQPNITDNPDDG